MSAAGYFAGSDTWIGFSSIIIVLNASDARGSWQNLKAVSKDCECDWISIESVQAQHESRAEAESRS